MPEESYLVKILRFAQDDIVAPPVILSEAKDLPTIIDREQSAYRCSRIRAI